MIMLVNKLHKQQVILVNKTTLYANNKTQNIFNGENLVYGNYTTVLKRTINVLTFLLKIKKLLVFYSIKWSM